MANQRPAPAGEFLLYQTEDGHTRVECRFADATLWLSQAGMAVPRTDYGFDVRPRWPLDALAT